MLWTQPAPTSTTGATAHAGVAAYRDALHVVAALTGDLSLVHSVYDGTTWTSTVLSQQSNSSMALAEHQGVLVGAYRDTNGFVALMSWDHTSGVWTTRFRSTFTVQGGTTLAVHEGLLYLVCVDKTSGELVYCTWNGFDSGWSASAPIDAASNPSTSHTSALVNYDGALYLFYTLSDSGQVEFRRFAGPLISDEAFVLLGSVPGATPNAKALGATAYNGQLVLVMTTSDGVNHGFAWSYGDWTSLPLASFGTSTGGVAATTWQGALELVTMVTSNGQSQQMFSQGLAGGDRPVGAQPLWSCHGAAYASSSLSPNLFWGTSPFTVEAWINAASVSGTQYILSNILASGGDPVGPVALALRDGVLSLRFADRWTEVQGPPVSAGEWHHVAASFDGAALSLLIDGTTYAYEQFTLADVAAPPSPSGAVLIGAASTSGGVTGIFSGTISRVAVFSAARTEAEVKEDQFARVLPQGTLVALFDFGRANPVDESMRGVAVTASGTPTWLAQTNALRFNGAGGLNLSGADNEDVLSFTPDEDLSIVAWVLPDSPPGTPGTILYRSGQYVLSINHALGVVAQAGGGDTYATSNGLVSTTTWTQVALIYKGGQLSVLVNGVRHALTVTSAVPTSNSHHTSVGSRPAAGGPYTGAIGTLSVWRCALEPDQLTALRALSPLDMPHLAAFYDFTTTSLDDASLQNPTPTLIGSGLALVLVNEVISRAACQAMDVVNVAESARYELDEEQEIVGWILPEGQTVAGQRSLTSEQTVWLIKLLLTIILGFAGILGLSVGSKLAGKLQNYLVKHQGRVVKGLNRYFSKSSKWKDYGEDAVGVLVALASNAPGVALDILIGLIANVVLDMLRGLWDEGVLRSIFEVITENLSWWDFANLIVNLAAFLIPGANAAKVASILIQLAVMAEQLIRLALDSPWAEKPALEVGTEQLAPVSKRGASLEAQLSRA